MECEVSSVLTGTVAPFGTKGEPSGYRKTIRTGKVAVAAWGLAGDEQADLVHHGGTDKAIHHYALDHYPAWIAERPDLRDIFRQPGAFGENVASSGWVEEDICIGDRFRMGTAIVEVSQGRQPCWKLGHRFGDASMMTRVIETGRAGWYYRVIENGAIEAGDCIRLLDRPHPQWSVSRVFRILIAREPTALEDIAALARVPQLSRSWHIRCRTMLA
ncbi:MAG: MOSC domain-containing protein [Sphingomonadaceae bacterium]